MRANSTTKQQRPETELYALLNVSPDASNEEIRRAFTRLAQHAHPDKHQDPELLDDANENFRRIREAYDILSDERKRTIYDIYGMEGVKSGLELGEHLTKKEEIIEELKRLWHLREEWKILHRAGAAVSLTAYLSIPEYLTGGRIMKRMVMNSEVVSQISKRDTISINGNMLVTGDIGAGAATAVLRHHPSPVASVELMAVAGLRSLLAVHGSRQLSNHSSATMGLAVSLRDGSINLSNTWTRQLSETSHGNIQLALGSESSIVASWKKKDEKSSAAGEVKFGTSSFGASAQYTRRFSKRSHGRVAGSIGSSALGLEIGGGRQLSDFTKVRMLYNIGIQGISWKFELQYGEQKLVIPVLLSSELNPIVATSALIIPSSIYFLLKKFVMKPYYLRRERLKARKMLEESLIEVRKAKEAARKAQKLLENASNRNKAKEMNKLGLVITKATYGNLNVADEDSGLNEDATSQVLDVTLPLNFLVSDSRLELPEGIKKSGIMGFCDPCPGATKKLSVEYSFRGQHHKVEIDDYGGLVIPQSSHRN